MFFYLFKIPCKITKKIENRGLFSFRKQWLPSIKKIVSLSLDSYKGIMCDWKKVSWCNNLKIRLIQILISLVCCCCTLSLSAQFYNGSQLSFGKNRVQHQKQNWEYYRTEQFDVYFYPTGKALAEYTLERAPKVIDEIETMLNYTSTKKIQFIVYNTQSDFRESNFAYDNDDFYNQGGVANIYGTKIYLYFDGNHEHFNKMMRAGVMNLYAHWIINGTSVGANIASESVLEVPAWYYAGLASYVGEKWSTTLDSYLKNGILTQRYADIDELSPVEATYAGHSFWHYIADRFGESAIPAILFSTRSARSYERGFLYVTGSSYKQLVIDWYKHYYIIYKKDAKRTKPDGNGELKRPKKARDYNQFRLSADGNSYAYVTNEAGKVIVWLKTEYDKKPHRIFTRYQKTEDNPDKTFPLLAWHPTGRILGFTLEDAGRCYYYPYNVEERKLEKRQLIDVEKITDFSFSNDGKLILFSGFQNGQSDIFVYSLRARTFQNLTNDFYDDYAPRFIHHDKQIIFSSNRPDNQLHPKEAFYTLQPQSHYDLFMMDYNDKHGDLLQLTYTPYANEHDVREIDERNFIYLSDENGISNRFAARFDSAISRIDTIVHYAYYAHSKPITDLANGIFEQDYASKSGTVAEVVLYKGVKRLYLKPYERTPLASQLTMSAFQSKLREDAVRADSAATATKAKIEAGVRHHGFSQVYRSELANPYRAAADNDLEQATDNTSFTHVAARNYYTQYSINKLVAQADFGFLNQSYQQFTGGTSPVYLNTGITAFTMVGLNDLFEDYRITGGFRLSFDLESNEFMFSYEDLHRRLDHQIVVYRQSIKDAIGDFYYKQHSNSVFYIMKYPFDKLNSLRLTLTGRYETYIIAGLDDYTLQAPDEKHGWGAIKLEYVFDSSKELYTNLWRGSKIKLFAEYQHRIDKDNMYLFVAGLDVRKSVKVYRNMTWATRFAASTNFGSARLVYYMGGVDNWIFAKFDSDIWVDQSKNYAYQTLATNMRGFKQNIRNGTSFMLLSTELRIPFVQLIARRQIANSFFNSLQLIAFGDVGTAWTGLTPYSEDNCLYTRWITAGDITACVKRQVDPFVGSFGLGLRAKLFGYFLRLDYAWGVEDFKIANKRGMLMFSLGLDF